ncbi:MYND finger [Botrytis cinerea]
MQPLATAVPSMDAADGFNIRPVRDVDRLPSMLPGFQGGLASQPESPTTPLPPAQMRSPTVRATSMSVGTPRSRRQMTDVSTADIQATNVNIQDVNMDENDSMLTAVETPLGLTTPTVSEAQDAGTFNITHRSAMDGSMINDATTPTGPTIGLSPAQPTTVNTPPTMPPTTIPRYFLDRPTPPQGQVLAAMPRDEDVLMSLQLLAYVSKYCNLRSYFQQSHLVPKLKIGSELQLLDVDETNATTPAACSSHSHDDEAEEEEYLLPDDFNIFPLVEKFTVRHHSQDMQYWQEL